MVFSSRMAVSAEQLRLARRDCFAFNFVEANDGVFNTDGWIVMALVAYLGSPSHILMHLVVRLTRAAMVVDWVWLTISWKWADGMR